MVNPESQANPEPQQPFNQRTSMAADREGKLRKIVTSPDGSIRVEDFPDLSAARDMLLEQQEFEETVDPIDQNFDHEAFAMQHETADSPNLDAIAAAVRRQREVE